MVSLQYVYIIFTSHIGHRRIYIVTGCVPSFYVSVIENIIRAKYGNSRNVILESLEFYLSLAQFVQSGYSFFILSCYVSCVGPYLERMN